MRVIDIARKTQLSPETVRHYTRLGLLHPSRDPHSGYKVFDDHDVTQLCFIRDARTLGLSVTEIQALIAAAEEKRTRHPEVAELLQRQLTLVRERMRRLRGVERRWREVLARWDEQSGPTGGGVRDIIESWSEQELSCEIPNHTKGPLRSN